MGNWTKYMRFPRQAGSSIRIYSLVLVRFSWILQNKVWESSSQSNHNLTEQNLNIWSVIVLKVGLFKLWENMEENKICSLSSGKSFPTLMRLNFIVIWSYKCTESQVQSYEGSNMNPLIFGKMSLRKLFHEPKHFCSLKKTLASFLAEHLTNLGGIGINSTFF